MLGLKWIVLAVSIGIGMYFSLPSEPSSSDVIVGLAMVAIILIGVTVGIKRKQAPYPMLSYTVRIAVQLILCITIGVTAAKIRTELKSTEFFDSKRRAVLVSGQVTNIDQRRDGPRVFVSDAQVLRGGRENSTGLIRVKWRIEPVPQIGDRVEFKGVLNKPSGPLLPGGFDFQRNAYFQGLSAYGYTVGKTQELTASDDGLQERIRLFWVRLRQKVTLELDENLTCQPAALAIALITNQRQRISEENPELFRKSGLAHLLAISGLHVGLVATMVFLVIRYGLALVRPVALRWKTKKLAAAIAVFFCLIYVLLTGGSIPTQRAFMMTCLVLGAVFLDRRALSARVIMIAALVLLLWSPEVLMSASFQMSFAAVGGLIVAYELLAKYRQRNLSRNVAKKRNVASVPFAALAKVVLSSIIATLATAPFAAFHFNLISLGGIVANLIAIPAAAFVVMPAGFLGLVLMPVGLEAAPLWAMEQGMLVILETARMAADFPTFHPFAAPASTVLLATFAISFFLLLTAGRVVTAVGFGALATTICVGAVSMVQRPDILIGPDNEAVALFDRASGNFLQGKQPSAFLKSYWEQAYAVEFLSETEDRLDGYKCDANGCLLKEEDRLVAFPKTFDALRADCEKSDLIITTLFLPKDFCRRTAALIIDQRTSTQSGAISIQFGDGKIEVKTTSRERGVRPWVQ